MDRVAARASDRARAIAARLGRAVTARELAWLAASVALFAAGARVYRWGLDKADPRRATVRAIRAEASSTRDVVVFADESPELVEAVAPVPAVYGAPPLTDLTGFRRLYVVAPGEGALVPYEARLGAPTAELGANAMRWDLANLATVRFDLAGQLVSGAVVAHRDGGPHGGPCERAGAILRCHSPDDWNHLRVDDHIIAGTTIRCLFAHPQANSRLVIEVPQLPAARALVGMVALDDRAYFPAGAAVTSHVVFEPSGGGARVERDVIAPNRRGPTPYHIDLGGRAGRLSFAITTPNAGARQYCFTAYATD